MQSFTSYHILLFLCMLLCTIVQVNALKSSPMLKGSFLNKKELINVRDSRLYNWFSWNSNGRSNGKKNAVVVPTISDDAKKAYQSWLQLNGDMKETARNYLTLEKCAEKFENLASTVGDSETAVQIVAVDPTILSYSKERISESFDAWADKLGSREEAIKLVIRNPPVLSIGQLFVKGASKGEVAQTYFWSYFAVAFRPLTLGLQKVISNTTRKVG